MIIIHSGTESSRHIILQGLTSNMFWEHQDELLQASRVDLSATVQAVVSASNVSSTTADWIVLPNPINKILGKLSIISNANLPSPLPSSIPDAMLGTGLNLLSYNS